MFNEGVTVNLFKDDDHNQPLGEDDEITTDDPLYGQLEVTFTQNQRPTKEHPNVSYQFPSNIKITPQTMDLVDNGVVVGKTIIDENGLVTLKYNEAYFSGNKEVNDASFKFNFKMESEPKGDNDSISIIFPGTGTTTVVKTKDGDADVSKFGGDISKSWEGPIFNADDGTYTWTVKVSPKSFATNVNVFDEIGSNLEFVEGSFTMIDSNGASTGASCDAKITSPTTAEIALGDLPKGDYYLQYKTKVKSLPSKDGVAVSGNSNKATVKWGSKQDHSKEPWVPGPAETKYSMVSKSSSGTNDRIKWVVELNNGSLLADMGGYSFNDVFADQELLGDEVTIVGADGKTIVPNNLSKSDGSLSSVLPEDAGKQKITVTYYTKMKDTSSKDAVSNTATVTPSDPSHGPEGSGSASYTPSDKDSYITKELTSSIDSETYDGKASWQSTIDFGAMSKTTDPTSIVFTDKFSSLPSGTRVSLDGDVIVSASSDSLVAGDDYDIQTASDQGSNGELIRIQFKGSQKIKDLIGTSGAKVTISYSTVSSQVDGTYPAGNYVNQSFIKTSKVDKSAGAQYTITHEATPPAVKKNGKDATWDADYSWADGSKGAWISDWTVYVNGSGEPGSAVMDLKGKKVTVTDSLPSGSEIVSGSTKFKLMDKGGYNGSNQEEVVPSIADGVATFTIPTANAQYTWKEPMGTQVSVVLTYQTAFKATAEQVGIDDLKLANKAQASTEDFTFPEGSGESKVDTRVLTKNGSQDYKSSTAEYSIEVNPNKMNLNPGGSTVTLVDDMDANCKFAGDLQVFDADGNVLDASSWSKRFENVSENGSTHTRLTLTLPDERHLKVTYKVTPLGEWKSTVELTNTCSLNGINGSTTPFKKGFTVWNASSETSSTSYGISVNKYDATMTNRLQGAVFGLYRVSFDASGAPQLSLEKTETTDSSGVAKFGDKADGLGSNTLFAFKELSAPEGFKVTNEDPTYFIIKGTDLNAFDAALNEARSHGINPETSNVSFDVFDDELDNVTGSIALSVQKKVNDNDPADDASFNFQLSSLTDDAPMPASGEEKISTVGKDEKNFGSITFDKPGTYKYKIEETSLAPDDGNVWTMAEPVYAQVTVGNAADGSKVLPTSVKYYSDEACEHEVSDSVAVFNNTFKAPDSVAAQLKIHKAVEAAEGSNLDPDERFTFDLYEATEQGDKTDKKIGDTISVKKDGDAVFDLPAFTAAGTYNYVIHETGHDTNGWTPAPDVKVQVVVGKSGDGTRFEVKSITYNGKADECASFVDKYTPATGAFSIDIQKTVNDSLENGIAKGYTFSATATGGNADQAPNLESVATGDDGKASFAGSLKESDMGKTYTYKISETSSLGTGWTKAADVYATVVVSDSLNNDGDCWATVSYSANEDGSASYDGAAQFVNKYVPATGSFSLNLVKTVNGKSENVSGFKFAATSNDEGAPSLGEQETDNQGKASFTFDGLDDSYEGKEFTYTISETSSLGTGWTKAADVVAKVNIGQRGDDNKFHPTVTYGNSGSDTGAKFDNVYKATGSVTLSVAKQVNGANPSSGQSFSYELIPIGSAPMPEGKESLTTSTLGSVASSFDSIPYCLDDAGKKFEYRIHETTPQTVGWTMAGDVIAKVTVGEDNGDGILKPSTVEYVKAENDQVSASVDDQNSAALFNNLYQQASGKFQLGLTKTVNGSAPLKGETFGFAATAIGDNATDAPKLNNVTTDENGEAKFAEATLADKDAGKTYTYRIHEVSDLADDSGAWTKAPDVIATVQVSDRSSSNELAATVSYKQDSNNAESYEGAAAFNNLHADKKAETVLKVSKTVNGAEDKNLQKQFGFQLQPKDGAPMPKSDVATVTGTTSASFDKIVYDKVGIYNYVIHESSEAGSGWTNADDVEATVEVGYAENGRDLVVKSIKYNNRQTDAATFNNTYEATGSVTLSVAKQVNGKSPLANEKFQFQLAGQDGAPMPAEGTTCETVGSAPAQFGSIPFALADAGKTYIYTITETTQGSSEWKIAGPVTATVTVGKDNGDGTLSAPTVTYSVSGMNGGAALFNNTYETSTQATVNVHKTVTGGTDKVKNESFDFELHKADEQGNMTDEVVGTVSAKADETKSFNPIKYTTSDAGKTFTYWIHEKGHNDKGWTADKDTKVTVKVVENADRSLSAEVSYERGTSAAEFTNAYATSGQATLSVFKTVNGGTEQGAGQKFHFDLYKADDQGNAQGEKVDSVETVVGEKAGFGAIDLSGEGTYHYVIKESGYNNGAWFAAGDVIATVTATDNGDGTLKTEVAYSDPDVDKSAALFDNVYAPTNASIWVKKTVNGEAAPVDKHFTFELQAQDGAPMPGEATADTFGGDTCSFGDIEFTEEGEYRYVIHETADLGEGWTNAADVPVTVKVVRDEDAKTLKVESISYGNNAYEENGQAMALFDNKYEAPEQPKGDTPKADTPNSEGGQPVASDGAKSSGTKTGDSMILAGGALALVAVAAAGIAAFALRRRK